MAVSVAIVVLLAFSTNILVHAGHVRCVCSPAECEQLTESDCPVGSGLVWDPCGCCKLCSRLEFEACGGPDGFHGSCADGLECVVTTATLEGVCRRVTNTAEATSQCGSRAHVVSGCNIVENRCRCHETSVCPGDVEPFSFQGRDECEINLMALLEQHQVSDSGVNWGARNAGHGNSCPIQDADKVINHGDIWWSDDHCTECYCKNGVLECQNSHCSSCINPHYKPGECCPVCHESDIHLHHCTWIDNCSIKCKHGLRRDEHGCFHCECLRHDGEECPLQCPGDRYFQDDQGRTLCECVNSSTNVINVPPPFDFSKQHSCKEFVNNNWIQYAHGFQWSDKCRQCACSNGVMLCSLIACPRCPGASISVDGECCPRCNGSASEASGSGSSACQSADGAVWQVGSRWRLDAACAWCECWHGGQVLCGVESTCPPAPCANPVHFTGECCPKCMATEYRPEPESPLCPVTRIEGEAWRDGACTSCLCIKGRAACFEEMCQPPACAFPITVKGRCCPVCINSNTSVMCTDGNVTRYYGDTWWRNPCVLCVCRDGGRVTCTTQQHCNKETSTSAQCCSACSADGAVIASDSHGYQIATIMLSMLLVMIIAIGTCCWCRRRGGFQLAAAKVRSCRSPTVLTYNPVKLCSETEQQPSIISEQGKSFVKV